MKAALGHRVHLARQTPVRLLKILCIVLLVSPRLWLRRRMDFLGLWATESSTSLMLACVLTVRLVPPLPPLNVPFSLNLSTHFLTQVFPGAKSDLRWFKSNFLRKRHWVSLYDLDEMYASTQNAFSASVHILKLVTQPFFCLPCDCVPTCAVEKLSHVQ